MLGGRRYRVSRGLARGGRAGERELCVHAAGRDLESRRALAQADEGELRLQEAKRLREKIDSRLAANPNLNLVVLGDFNDTCDSPSIRPLIGRGKRKLIDSRPRTQRRQHPERQFSPGLAAT